MRHLLAGFKISALFGMASVVLMILASLAGLKSLWWPIFWPAFLFLIAGYPFLFLIDSFPTVAAVIAPGGGAPGIFIIACGGAFFIWGLVFSLISWYRLLKRSRRESAGTNMPVHSDAPEGGA
jgi:hypothetical protein